MKNYNDLLAILKDRSSKKLENNTYLLRRENYLAIKLHNTEILKFYPNNEIVIDVENWYTRTTKDRINNYLGHCIYQKKNQWFITFNGETYIFKNGVVIDQKNNLIKNCGTDKDLKNKSELLKKINKFSAGLIQALLDKKLDIKDKQGDCFFCQFKLKDTDHFISHFKEKYYQSSIIINAIDFYPVSFIAKNEIGFYLNCHNQTLGDFGKNILINQLKKSLVKYLKNQFGL